MNHGSTTGSVSGVGSGRAALAAWADSWWPTVVLIVGLAVLRLVYLAWLCPYNLIEDEAHYWEWSRHLEWSYYTKGPGIALAIRAATALFGTGEWAIRAVAVMASAVATGAVAGLAGDVAARAEGRLDRRMAFLSAALFQLAPVNQVVGMITTIDGPYLACWAVACWAAWRALMRRSGWAWVALGAALGLGFVFKYTVLLLAPGILGYAFIARRDLKLASAWPALAGLAALLMGAGLTPVLVWNAQNGWPTVHHLLGHLGGVPGGDMPPGGDSAGMAWTYDPRWTLEFIGMQVGMVGPGIVLAAVGVVQLVRARRTNGATPARALDEAASSLSHHSRLFLVWCAAPILVFYLAVTFIAQAEGNWPIAAYVTLLPLGAGVALDGMREHAGKVAAWRAIPPPRPKVGRLRRGPETLRRALWHFSFWYGVIGALAMVRIDLIARVLTPDHLGRVGSLIGARAMAAHVTDLEDRLRAETGQEPLVMAQHYGRTSILAFYLPGRPEVYCTSSRMGGRRTQYDYWAQTDLDDHALRGRPAVVVGGRAEQWASLFDHVEPAGRLRGEHKKDREAFLGYGYRGFAGH